jgi:hypothetical protein
MSLLPLFLLHVLLLPVLLKPHLHQLRLIPDVLQVQKLFYF